MFDAEQTGRFRPSNQVEPWKDTAKRSLLRYAPNWGISAVNSDPFREPLRFTRREYAWDFQRRAVKFWGRSGDTSVACYIAVQALQNHFDLQGDNGALAQEAFASGRVRIEALAAQKWNAGAVEPDGSLVLRSEDF